MPAVKEYQIKVMLPAGAGMVFDAPRYEIGPVAYVVRPEALILSSTTAEADLPKLEDIGNRIVSELPHTPITGIGHNFEFRTDHPEQQNLAVFSASRQDISDVIDASKWAVGASTIVSTFVKDGVQMNIQRMLNGDNLTVKFNFHHPVSSNLDARRILTGDGSARMEANLAFARELVSKTHGLDQDADVVE